MLDWFSETMLKIVTSVPALFVAEDSPLDISKVTCDQYNAYKVTNPQNIAIWVNGYYHGKRGDVTLETQRLVENARKLRDYCRRNRETLVLEAVETLFGKDR
jgi:acid stress chaperone HdeB